jgi:signal transduction histidine kinase
MLRPDHLVDAVLACLVTGGMLATLAGGAFRQGRPTAIVVLAGACAVCQGVPLLWRRRNPAAVLAVTVLTGVLAHVLIERSAPAAGSLVALAAFAAAQPPRRSLWATAVVAGCLLLSVNLVAAQLLFAGFLLLLTTTAWAVGESGRGRIARLALAEERLERADRERALEAARAAADERDRIARELHDIVAHNVSVMVVQAAAADDVFDSTPDRARDALRSIADTGRAAMEDLRGLLGATAAGGPLAPQPSLDRLDGLVEQVRAAGLPVAVTVAGEPRRVPAAVELSAYRIVQEALTNALRHARAGHADVRVTWAPAALELEIADDGIGGAPGSGGRGLVGMGERAAMLGGRLEAGPRPGRPGFAVRASLPVPEASA